jgi:hypothetical protein
MSVVCDCKHCGELDACHEVQMLEEDGGKTVLLCCLCERDYWQEKDQENEQ